MDSGLMKPTLSAMTRRLAPAFAAAVEDLDDVFEWCSCAVHEGEVDCYAVLFSVVYAFNYAL